MEGLNNYHISHLSEETNNNIIARLNKIKGHIEAINKMINENRTCEEIITQLYAVKSAINETIIKIVEEHIDVKIKGNKEFSTEDTIELINLVIRVLKMK